MVVYVRQPLVGGQRTTRLMSWSQRFIVAYGVNMELWNGDYNVGVSGWGALELPPCSPYFNPCAYNLIPISKRSLQGEQSANGEDVVTVAWRLVARISAFGNADGVGRLRRRWRRTMGKLGDYFEVS